MRFAILPILCLFMSAGCAHEFNPTPISAENQTLERPVILTTNFQAAGEAYFSRDMRWIIFQAVPDGETHYQMYVAALKSNASGITGIGLPIRISPQSSWNTCGYFSPDGNSLIFSSTGDGAAPKERSGYQRDTGRYVWQYPANAEIFRADGWQGAIAAAQPGGITNLAKHPITSNNAYDAECAISPDGKWIIFTSNRTGDLELFAMRMDGSDAVQLTHVPGYDGGPFISPDGKRITYRSDRKRAGFLQIYTAELTFDPAGKISGIANERELTHDLETVNWGPYWHPDGRHIIYAYSGTDHSNYDLWMMRDDGTHKTRITLAAGADVLPSFSTDGRYLLWTSKRGSETSQIYVSRFQFPRGS